jgi:acyl-CoA dehydrogenase
MTEAWDLIRLSIREVCASFPATYWRGIDVTGAYPEEFVSTLTELGWLSVLIPERFGGGGQGITEASIILEEIHRSGGNANACHAQMYTMGAILRHGSQEQQVRYLPEIAAGNLRLQAFAVTEADAGSDTTQIATHARRIGNRYVVNGEKTYISRVEQSDLMLLLARTTPLEQVQRRTDGLSIFLVDLRAAGDAVSWARIPLMFNHHTYQVFFNDLDVPVENLVGREGEGFRYILDGMNAERILIASEAIGDGLYFIDRAAAYASERLVFNRPIGSNQGIQFPLAHAYAALMAAGATRDGAAKLFDAGEPCGPEANIAKLLASEASWEAANAAVNTYGGNAFAVEYDIERKFRETRLFQTAPISNNLVLAYLGQHVLGMPRSY